ncbi:MAG: glycine C-acetyltransferase [Verrucomicrobia bacterium]|nr:glycine C-acetyltransferase [Verrucomicrobiota bacterium]
MTQQFKKHLERQMAEVKAAGLYKPERVLGGPQGTRVRLADGREVINLCSNNYLGLAQHPEVREAAKRALEEWGYGLASVRFICGTQSIHKQLEERISRFLGAEDTILFSSCWDANGAVFEALLGPEDAVFSDELNHASIIDGIRLCKAQRFRYRNNDPADLEAKLREAKDARFRLIVSDGVFSMDGYILNLPAVCELAERYEALVMVDDSHATGVLGRAGRGVEEHYGLSGKIDILTGTLGKALGGSSGGYAAGRKEIVEWLRQRGRPYLFSNTVAPPVAAGALKAVELAENGLALREHLAKLAGLFRRELERLGFDLLPGEHPIVPIMLGDAALSARYAEKLLELGVYVVSFGYPVVPKGKARIRTQMTAAHTEEDIHKALEAFAAAKRELG